MAERPTTMGGRIETERLARGWSQQRLCDEIKKVGGSLSQSGLDRLEKRGSGMSKQSVYIARALEVNHDWLITGKGPKSGLPSIDARLQLLPAGDLEDLHDDIMNMIEHRLEKRGVRQ
jgi:transcriptional regulator with XRE-family HTH domain